jgi:sec-independent protein translocase protein TatB
MFGIGMSEAIMIGVVAILVIGPKDMPKVMRKLGRWASDLRRMAANLRVQSGIDEALRAEGIADDIREIRKLARGELDGVMQAADMRTILREHAEDRAREQSKDGDASKEGGASSENPEDPYAEAIAAEKPYYPSSRDYAGGYGDNDSAGYDGGFARAREYPSAGADDYGAVTVYGESALPASDWATDATYNEGDAAAFASRTVGPTIDSADAPTVDLAESEVNNDVHENVHEAPQHVVIESRGESENQPMYVASVETIAEGNGEGNGEGAAREQAKDAASELDAASETGANKASGSSVSSGVPHG